MFDKLPTKPNFMLSERERSQAIRDTLDLVNSKFIAWKIAYCEDEHSSWWVATLGDQRFERGSIIEVARICRILNGWDKPWEVGLTEPNAAGQRHCESCGAMREQESVKP